MPDSNRALFETCIPFRCDSNRFEPAEYQQLTGCLIFTRNWFNIEARTFTAGLRIDLSPEIRFVHTQSTRSRLLSNSDELEPTTYIRFEGGSVLPGQPKPLTLFPEGADG